MDSDIIIIGGGASGLMAAITAAEAGASVIVIDHNKRVGQKILMTGNGKCNLTNIKQEQESYRGEDAQFALQVLSNFQVKDTISFFSNHGLMVKNKNGYIYPISEQASTVLDILRVHCENLGVICHCETSVKSIQKHEDFFTVTTEQKCYTGKKVILATGGKTYPKTGSDGSGYLLAQSLGHSIVKPLPALTGLQGKENFFKSIAGVRSDAKLFLHIDDKLLMSERGELQLTEYGISGIPVFQLSRFVAKAIDTNSTVKVIIDFLPDIEFTEIIDFLEEQIQKGVHRSIEQLLSGVLNKKIAGLMIRQQGLSLNTDARTLSLPELKEVVKQIKHFEVNIEKTNSFDQAQVCAGGVNTKEVYSVTLESKLVQGLYIIGELLDIDGACGGYNLQWAWSTGYLAGKNAAEGSK